MILPDLILPSRVTQRWLYSGMDSLEHCLDKQHFQNYPYSIDYVYNSRGFRDQEWPDSEHELLDAIWCLGDSFTVGIGQPLSHIWPQVLATATVRRCINVSMDGASNDWICRRALDIMSSIGPVCMAVMWSYTHRRESDRIDMSDEHRRVDSSACSFEQDYNHWISLSNQLYQTNNKIVQVTIPNFHANTCKQQLTHLWNSIKGPDWPIQPKTLQELEQLPKFVLDEIIDYFQCYERCRYLVHAPPHEDTSTLYCTDVIHMSQCLDLARDHHHFDILTSQWVVDLIRPRLCA